MKLISIVVPVYYNEFNLPDTIPQLLDLQHHLQNYTLELVFVDDGSGDRSLDILMDFQLRYPETIKVVKLTRNFGSMAAIQAGFTVAKGDCVGMISADLQDPPELFQEMIGHWEKGTKAIFAVRKDRDDPLISKWFADGYYSLVQKFAIKNYPKGGFDFFVIDRQLVDEINRIQEKNTNLMALIFWLGFQPILIPYTRRQRSKGRSRWTLSKKVKMFVDTFISFTFFPIRVLSIIGFLVAMISLSYGLYVLIYWALFGVEVKGYVPTMLIIAFTTGIQMAMLGVVGEYLWRTLDEVRRRPSFIVDEIYDKSNPKFEVDGNSEIENE